MAGPCRVGTGYRGPLGPWIEGRPPELECLEVTDVHHRDAGGAERLRALARDYPLMVHGLGLSLGTPGPLDAAELDRFAAVVEAADPLWISEHIGFVRTGEVELAHFNPVPPTPSNAELVAGHAREVAERCGKPILLENITTHLRVRGTLAETDFLGRICDAADCGLLLDVTNLFINSRNHGFDAGAWLRDLDPERIIQLHVVGYAVRDGRYYDGHGAPLQPELWDLLHEVLAYAPVRAVILEWDRDFPPPEAFAAELRRLKEAVTAACA